MMRIYKQPFSSVYERYDFPENKNLTSKKLKMNKIMFNVKQLKMSKFIKYIWQLIISNSNVTLEVPSLGVLASYIVIYHPIMISICRKVLVRTETTCVRSLCKSKYCDYNRYHWAYIRGCRDCKQPLPYYDF